MAEKEAKKWFPLGRHPLPTVDVIIETGAGVVLVKRKYPPLGWSMPGGFIDWGESPEQAATREAKEETGLEVRQLRQFHAYGDPARDPRCHTITIVYAARAAGKPKGADDAAEAKIFAWDGLPADLTFDHRRILEDYRRAVAAGFPCGAEKGEGEER
jgi:8-oxo-dGTP diphosphatase